MVQGALDCVIQSGFVVDEGCIKVSALPEAASSVDGWMMVVIVEEVLGGGRCPASSGPCNCETGSGTVVMRAVSCMGASPARVAAVGWTVSMRGAFEALPIVELLTVDINTLELQTDTFST